MKDWETACKLGFLLTRVGRGSVGEIERESRIRAKEELVETSS